jgi:hypothetical protein
MHNFITLIKGVTYYFGKELSARFNICWSKRCGGQQENKVLELANGKEEIKGVITLVFTIFSLSNKTWMIYVLVWMQKHVIFCYIVFAKLITHLIKLSGCSRNWWRSYGLPKFWMCG